MHELSLCQSIYRIVRQAVPDRPVVAVHIDVGQLRQAVPESMVYCWGIVVQGTALDGSKLLVRTIAGAVECASCRAVSEFDFFVPPACPACGGAALHVVAGEEFTVRAVDVAKPGPRASSLAAD
ncbi:MAG: hydrogenase maturation nickel metallochaperone HypA [Bifidobacteriaceae bacterium]|jgi:hydrogenase nickel incorporation protein HypA/HybF|nr:hydrogenase maturation nickel metallochaperone HypA [Bifidobacteriaceae bacterium]